MRRDMELVRRILRTIIDKNDLIHREIEIDGFDPIIVQRHVVLLLNAGYVDGIDSSSIDQGPSTMVSDLTWEGHEFAGALLTDDSTWEKVKAAFGPEQLATVPLKLIGSVATAALTAWATQKLGLS